MDSSRDAGQDLDDLDDRLLVWAREIPTLDPLTEGIVERIHILAHRLNESQSETLAEFDLDRRAFNLVMRLRSYGPPYRRSAGMLAADLQLSSGAMTNRLDQLEKGGLVKRLPDPDDRRGVLVELTPKGRRVHQEAIGIQAEREALLAEALSQREKEQLNDLLRRVMLALESRFPGRSLS